MRSKVKNLLKIDLCYIPRSLSYTKLKFFESVDFGSNLFETSFSTAKNFLYVSGLCKTQNLVKKLVGLFNKIAFLSSLL